MKKRLSFPLTALIFVLSIIIYFGIAFWLSSMFNWPEWAYAIWYYVFFLLVYEIPSRFGPQPFNTPLSTYFKLRHKDKLILGVSFLAIIICTIIMNENKDKLSMPTKVLSAILTFAIIFGPIWFFGSPEAKAAIFSKNKHAEPVVKEDPETTNQATTEQSNP